MFICRVCTYNDQLCNEIFLNREHFMLYDD
jgi:hypothetical protein